MKKSFFVVGFIAIMTLIFGSTAVAKTKPKPSTPPTLVVNGTIVNTCYQKINGQLRVVSDPTQCRPSEFPLALSAAPSFKKIFITSQTYVGSQIGGITQADALCNALATTAVPALTGKYKAWVSDETMGPATTFAHAMAPYVNTHGEIVANDWIGLTSGALLHAVLYDESGDTPLTNPLAVWTGTDPIGNPVVGQTCAGWTAAGLNGTQGIGTETSPEWTMTLPSTLPLCSTGAHLYCIEQ